MPDNSHETSDVLFPGARRYAPRFPLFDVAESLTAKVDRSGWDSVNPDFPELDRSWTALHFIEAGAKTEFYSKWPEVTQIADFFECTLHQLMLYALQPGARLPPHKDLSGNVPLGRVRFHIPIVTNDAVDFFVARNRIVMRAGEFWALDTSYTHWVHNRGTAARIHLIAEAVLNDWCEERIPPKNAVYYAHLPPFVAYAIWKRGVNLVRKPSLIPHTFRQIRTLARRTWDRRAKK